MDDFSFDSNPLRQQLNPGETIQWTGQPRQGIFLRTSDAYMIPFSLLWGGFAIVWETLVLTSMHKAPGPIKIAFPLFGIPFVLIGLYIMLGRFFVDARVRRYTSYAVTNQRVLIITGRRSTSITSLNAASLTQININNHTDGTATIIFGQPFPNVFLGSRYANSWTSNGRYPSLPTFDHIEGADKVFRLIQQLQHPSTHRGLAQST